MALFKILRGQKASLDDQAIHDGWCYFTPDTGEFFIDIKENNDVPGERKAVSVSVQNINQTEEDELIFQCGDASPYISQGQE